MEKNYKEILNQIQAFVFDVDGVLTDGNVIAISNGEQLRRMSTRDGFAITDAITKGYKMAIITGGNNKGVKERLKYLGVEDIYLPSKNKVKDYNNFKNKYALNDDDILYMGDDIPDLKVMSFPIMPCCPSNAVPEIKSISKYISPNKGGGGCVRDVIEQTLKVQNKWY